MRSAPATLRPSVHTTEASPGFRDTVVCQGVRRSGSGSEAWSPMTEALVGMGLLEKKAAKKTASPGDVERAAVRRAGQGRPRPW